MRVLHVIARLNEGGTAVYLENLSNGLSKAGIENAIATGYVQTGETEDECINHLPIIRVPHLGRAINPISDVFARREIQQVIRDFKPDIIHSHTFKAGLLSRSLSSPSKRVHTYHGHILGGGYLLPWQKSLVIAVERYLANRTDLLISVGERVASELKDLGIGDNTPWVSIPPGISFKELPHRSSAANRLGLDATKLTVGWMGRMVDVKDPFLALEIAKSMPSVQFVLAGDGELLKSIRAIAPSNVFLPGWVNKFDVLAASDVLMLTSTSEGMSLAAIEALSTGVALVAPSVGSLPEIIATSMNGFVVEREVEAYSQKIVEIFNRSGEEVALAKKSTASIKLQFSARTMVNAHIAQYGEILEIGRNN